MVYGTTSFTVLGYEHSRKEPAIVLWNDDRHLSTLLQGQELL